MVSNIVGHVTSIRNLKDTSETCYKKIKSGPLVSAKNIKL